MNIGIIGAGNVGGSLGFVWAKQGHKIMYGVRDANSPKTQAALAAIGDAAQVGTPAEAAAFGEVIVIAVTWPGVRQVMPTLGDVSGKILIDATNRLNYSPQDGELAAGDIANMAVGARVVKAFNTMGSDSFLNPTFSGHPATAFIAGDDNEAKETVIKLASEIGLDARDSGPLENARYIEGMGSLWVFFLRNGLGRDYAYALLPR